MLAFTRLCFVLLTSLSLVAAARSDEFDLYYLGGQSNMEGFGTTSELEPTQQQAIEGAWIYQSTPMTDQQPALGLGRWAQLEPGHGTGFSSDGNSNSLSNRFGVELSFAAELRQRLPKRKIAIIKYARNGSSIDSRAAGQWGCWDPDFGVPTGAYRDVNQYDQFLATVRHATAVQDIDGDGSPDRLIPAGIVWMQGESDASYDEEIAQRYAPNLQRLMDLMRASLRVDDLPVAIGRISDAKRGTPALTWKHGETVRAAQANFVYRDRAARLITETDQYQYSDPWHYDSRGYLELGKRFAEAMLSFPHSSQESMFEEGAKLTVEVGDGAGGEGPTWDPEWGVLTSGNGNIHRWSRDRVAAVFREGAGTNGLLLDAQSRLVACEPKMRRVTRMDRDGTLKVLTDSFEGKAYNTPNDLTLDSKGRIYFSDPRYGDRSGIEMRDEQGQTVEGVYRIDLDGKVSRVLGREVDRANGVLVTANDQYLLVADNNNNTDGVTRKLWRFDLRSDGSVDPQSAKKLFDWGQGRGPDGLKQDAQGHLYVAAGRNQSNPPFEPDSSFRAGIYVLDIDGRLLDFVAVPTDEATNCAFGGEDRKTLYVTAGGTLYSIRCKIAGR